MKLPKNFLFSEDHVWISPRKKGVVKMGVTEYITSFDNLEGVSIDVDDTEETEISAGDVIGEIVTSEGTFELISPVSGKVVGVNREAIENPDIISETPYSDGWLIEIEIDGDISSYSLLSPEEYEEFVDSL